MNSEIAFNQLYSHQNLSKQNKIKQKQNINKKWMPKLDNQMQFKKQKQRRIKVLQSLCKNS